MALGVVCKMVSVETTPAIMSLVVNLLDHKQVNPSLSLLRRARTLDRLHHLHAHQSHLEKSEIKVHQRPLKVASSSVLGSLQANIRKKAVMALHRFHQLDNDCITPILEKVFPLTSLTSLTSLMG